MEPARQTHTQVKEREQDKDKATEQKDAAQAGAGEKVVAGEKKQEKIDSGKTFESLQL